MAPRKPIKVGGIGCGGISGIYLKNMTETFSILEVAGCSDLIPERARARAAEFGCRCMTNEEILSDPEIEIVVNLTYPDAHYAVSKAALLAGKHVHTEKMMAVTWEEGCELAELANQNKLRLSIAPDTFLGGGYQTARKLLDEGLIGTPLYANAQVVRCYQHVWEDADLYQPFIMTPGGGIPFDMGGYYLHAMINLLGSVEKGTGFSGMVYEDYIRLNPRHPQYRESVGLRTPTMLSGTLSFSCGAYGSLTAISDGFGDTSRLEIYGTEGILLCHDPNYYGDELKPIRKGDSTPHPLPLTHGYGDADYRGLGVADLAWAITNNRPHRCGLDLGLHAFEVIHSIIRSGQTEQTYRMTTSCRRPEPLPSGFCAGTATEACLDDLKLIPNMK